MVPIQYVFLLALPPIVAASWFGGGRIERLTTGVVMVAIAFSGLLDGWRIGRSQTGAALCDLALFLALLYLALTRDRWWLLVVSATQGLAVIAHLALVLRPDLTSMENLTAVNVFYVLGLLGLGAGSLRTLAGRREIRCAGPERPTERRSRRGLGRGLGLAHIKMSLYVCAHRSGVIGAFLVPHLLLLHL